MTAIFKLPLKSSCWVENHLSHCVHIWLVSLSRLQAYLVRNETVIAGMSSLHHDDDSH